MSRSGTESIRKALEALGYRRTYHGVRDLMAGQDGFIWGELVERKYGQPPQPITREHLDQILYDCAAVTDMPCCGFWPELMDAYPEAKILLVERDVEAWYRSFNKVIYKEVFSWKADVVDVAIRLGLLPANPNFFIHRLFLEYFQARSASEMMRNARSVYTEHYNAIEARARAEGRPLLRMRIEEGWEPICKFLDKKRPPGYGDGALPRGNEWQKTVANTRYYQNRAVLMVARKVGLVLVRAGVGVALAVEISMWFRR